MPAIRSAIHRLLRDEAGQAMVEYPLIIALVSVVAIGVLTTLGGNIQTTISNAASKILVP